MQKDQDLPEQQSIPEVEGTPKEISTEVAHEEVGSTSAQPSPRLPKKKSGSGTGREISPTTRELLNELEQVQLPEEKISKALDFMRASLTQSGNPRFKDFWDMRHHCLGLFKENLSSTARAHLWSSYVELSAEARRLKEILDEQSTFASEQIELAITALEKDLVDYSDLIAQMKPVAEIRVSSTLRTKQEIYEKIQIELNLLNALAARINALRKEIIKTDMRMKTKAKFFDRLSLAGDQIFPRRKELVKEISEQFVGDVHHFVEKDFAEQIERGTQPLYLLREEIKNLQGIAKILTLNTQAFKETRNMLSASWDKIRECEKKKKEEFAQRKEMSHKNVESVLEKIALFSSGAEKEDASLLQLEKESKEILQFMRTLDLDRDAVYSLKAQIKKVLQPFVDRQKSDEEARLLQNRGEEQRKKEKIESLLQRAEELLTTEESLECEEIVKRKQLLEGEFARTGSQKNEKMRFEKIMKKIADLIVDKKEKMLLNLSAQDRAALEQLKSILQDRIQERLEIKKNLESYRKALGGSGFDFEKAMMYREMMDSDKMRLGKIDESIGEIEDRIAEIEG